MSALFHTRTHTFTLKTRRRRRRRWRRRRWYSNSSHLFHHFNLEKYFTDKNDLVVLFFGVCVCVLSVSLFPFLPFLFSVIPNPCGETIHPFHHFFCCLIPDSRFPPSIASSWPRIYWKEGGTLFSCLGGHSNHRSIPIRDEFPFFCCCLKDRNRDQ